MPVIVVALALGAAIGALALWRIRSRRAPEAAAAAAATRALEIEPVPPAAGANEANSSTLPAALAQASELLWQHAFRIAAEPTELAEAHRPVRAAILAAASGGALPDRYFPRRPMLMPQLQAAVNDPNAAPTRLADIVAQDPVLAGDVLRLANSVFYRMSPEPVETIQRAIIVCGTDGLQSLAATALMQPVFRGGQEAFARFPALLWERSVRASVAAELYAQRRRSGERLTAQLLTILDALGPLVVYRMTMDQYRTVAPLQPAPRLLVEMISRCAANLSRRVAEHWDSPPRLVAALAIAGSGLSPSEDRQGLGVLVDALRTGQLLGTLSLLESERVLDTAQAQRLAQDAGVEDDLFAAVWARFKRAQAHVQPPDPARDSRSP
jgi:HD-like signal output (HDOD) protein